LFTVFNPEMSKINNENGDMIILAFLGQTGIDQSKAREMLETYKKAREGKNSTDAKEIFNALLTDQIFRISTIQLLEAQSKHQPNTYNYMFTWPSPGLNGELGACHALEIPFLFNTMIDPKLKDLVGECSGYNELSNNIMDAWIAFARSGNPNNDSIPHWPPYNSETRSTMLIDEQFQVVEKFLDEERAAWDDLL
jgi:para-nitrobenzyl esterase